MKTNVYGESKPAELPEKFDEAYLRYTFEAPRTTSSACYAWDLETIRQARDAQLRGRLSVSARLAIVMKGDAAIYSALLNRIAPPRGLPTKMCAAEGAGHAYRAGGAAERIRVEAEKTFGERGPAFRVGTQADLFERLAMLGVFVGQNVVRPRKDGSRVDFRLQPWPMQTISWNEARQTLQAQTIGDGLVDVTHGDGKWVVATLHDLDPWQWGAVVPLALVWASRAFAIRDRSASAETHGDAPIIGTLPEKISTASDEGKIFTARLKELTQKIRAGMVKPFGSEVERLAWGDQAWQIFREIIQSDNSDAPKILLGQDGTVNNSGGNYIKSDVLFGVRNDIVEGDLRGAEYALNTGTIRPWTALNFGDIELAPHRKWLMPDPDEDVRRKSLAERTTAYNEAIAAYRNNGFVIDQAFADKLAADFGIEAPRLAPAKPPAPTPANVAEGGATNEPAGAPAGG